MQGIDLNKLKAILDTFDDSELVDKFARIKRVYETVFGSYYSNDVDFSSFAVEDIHDTLEDLSEYKSPDNWVEPDNSAVVIANLDAGEMMIRSLCDLTPAKLPLAFF